MSDGRKIAVKVSIPTYSREAKKWYSFFSIEILENQKKIWETSFAANVNNIENEIDIDRRKRLSTAASDILIDIAGKVRKCV